MDIVVSDPTSKRILDGGVKACVDEACLPVKLFHGHVLNLAHRADYIFIPRFTSISKREYVCPEFGGLPDMVRHTLKGLPPLIDTEVNLRNSVNGLIKAATETAALLGRGSHSAKRALKLALENYRDFKYQAQCGTLPFVPAAEIGGGNSSSRAAVTGVAPARLKVAVIGHPYNIYDKYISMDLLGKLKRYGVEAITIEMADDTEIDRIASTLPKPMFWNYGRKAYGAALCLADSGKAEGIIFINSFGCGIDSFVIELTERRLRRGSDIPLITITLDEHSGEAGFNTRLEAFIDMLRWRRANENHISASG